MKRIAILGGGISGLTAAYELELARRRGAPIDWHLYEASDRLGGIVETTRHATPDGTYILEGGPDAWVSQKPSEKPWARDLAIELGLEPDLIYSNDATRRTYILIDNQLQPIPDRMRLMVPEDLATLENSPLFSSAARASYAAELTNAAELKASSPFANAAYDESVASFVHRHFGEEVLATLAAPLLSGIFGGDVHNLSVRAVMPAFVAMERDHGSLIAALQCHAKQRTHAPQPIFTSLRNGMGSLVDALVAALPPERLHRKVRAQKLLYEVYPGNVEWSFWIDKADIAQAASVHGISRNHIGFFDHLILATSLDTTCSLLRPWDAVETTLLPSSHSPFRLLPASASTAVLATLCWPAETARTFTIPDGFGFLVPDTSQGTPRNSVGHDFSRAETTRSGSGALAPEVRLASLARSGANPQPGQPQHLDETQPQLLAESHPRILACTFVDQKFPHRCPPGARILRVFFGGLTADTLAQQPNETIASTALAQLQQILGPIPAPDPALTTIRRWPRSLPQYEVGHLGRMAQLDALIAKIPGLTLLGNSYRGVGLPDLIHAARTAARTCQALQSNHPHSSP